MMAARRKRIVVTMDEKLLALKKIDAGESGKKIAAEMGVGTSTISDWKKSRSDIEKWCSFTASINRTKKPKTMKKATNNKVNEALYRWFNKRSLQGLPISGPLLKEKALRFNKEIGVGGFKASDGWLESWKKHYGVQKLPFIGEQSSAKNEDGEQLYKCDQVCTVIVF